MLFHGESPSDEISGILKSIPTVSLLENGGLNFGSRIMPDHAFAGEIALQYFKNHGAKNVCCIRGSADLSYSQTRCEGFARAAEAHGIGCKAYEIQYEATNSTAVEQMEASKCVVDKILSQKSFPDGIFVSNTFSGFIHSLLQKAGKTPMQDFLMVASDEGECPPYLVPEPAKLKVHPKKLGILAAEVLLMKINAPEVPGFTGMIQPEVLIPAD